MALSQNLKPLAVDWETSGLRDENSPFTTYVQGPQGIQIGAAVLDPVTMSPIETFTARMRFLGRHDGIEYGEYPDLTWNTGAERIHGMTLRSLIQEPHPRMVAHEFAAFIRRHYGSGEKVVIVGHNPETDRYHTRQLLWFGGLLDDIRISHRAIDTHTIGALMFGASNSDELFKKVTGEKRTTHDALWDALAAGAVLKQAVTLLAAA